MLILCYQNGVNFLSLIAYRQRQAPQFLYFFYRIFVVLHLKIPIIGTIYFVKPLICIIINQPEVITPNMLHSKSAARHHALHWNGFRVVYHQPISKIR